MESWVDWKIQWTIDYHPLLSPPELTHSHTTHVRATCIHTHISHTHTNHPTIYPCTHPHTHLHIHPPTHPHTTHTTHTPATGAAGQNSLPPEHHTLILTGCAVAIVMTIVVFCTIWVESINYTVKQLKLREQASFPICTRFSLASMLKLCMAGFVPRSHAGVGLRFWGWGCKQTCDFQFWTRCLRKIVYVRVTSSALQIINPLNSASRLQ